MITHDKLKYIIAIAREIFEAAPAMINAALDRDKPSDHYTMDHVMDELSLLIPKDHIHDNLYQDFKATIEGLNDDDRFDLIALTWIGRGTYNSDEWDIALDEAKSTTNGRTAEYLINIPLLPDYLEEAAQKINLAA